MRLDFAIIDETVPALLPERARPLWDAAFRPLSGRTQRGTLVGMFVLGDGQMSASRPRMAAGRIAGAAPHQGRRTRAGSRRTHGRSGADAEPLRGRI